VTAVFPGEARSSKGLDILLSALRNIEGIDVVDLPTVVTTDAQFSVRNAMDERVRMGSEWLTNDEYYARLQAASLAILPYRRAAMANAGISSSLLDVLAVGLPAVITTPIARGLPAGYEGAIVVEPDSVEALAAGVNEAVRRRDDLRSAAREQGPAFVVKHHSYEQYLDSLLEAAGAR
jgi:glycosyltransferase involved in cell wall biosynthesis